MAKKKGTKKKATKKVATKKKAAKKNAAKKPVRRAATGSVVEAPPPTGTIDNNN